MLAVLVGGTQGTQDAVANGDTRTLSIYHVHTKESATITFRRNGRYDERALEQLNWLLRDWRRDEATRMDPRLFDTLWTVYREVGSDQPIHVVSAYRSPATNSMLRRRSRAVAKNSQHMLGKAMDFYLPDVSVEKIRAVGMRLQNGGVGYYPSAYTPFIHLDVGSVRAWPRMTRDQLVRLFPDGRTVHIPADGRPLPGYEEARAEVLARGGAVAGYTKVADSEDAAPAPGRRKSFWATLFGGGEDEDEDDMSVLQANHSRSRRTEVASAGMTDGESPSRFFLFDRRSSEPAPRPVRTTRVAAASAPEPEVAATAAPPAASRAEDPPAGIERTRVAAVSEPSQRFVWQAGPGGIAPGAAASADKPGLQGSLAPLPPRRPEDEPLSGVLAYAPMPPSRPSSIPAMPMPGQLALRGTAETQDGAGSMPAHPLPPPRPLARIADSPAKLEAAASTTASVPAPRDAGKGDRTQLLGLFSEAASARTASQPARAKPQPVAGTELVTAQGPALKLGFSSSPNGDLTPGRFTGPAVKALPVLR